MYNILTVLGDSADQGEFFHIYIYILVVQCLLNIF
jgi:hypothetical protein